jgi:hypothetical protein
MADPPKVTTNNHDPSDKLGTGQTHTDAMHHAASETAERKDQTDFVGTPRAAPEKPGQPPAPPLQENPRQPAARQLDQSDKDRNEDKNKDKPKRAKGKAARGKRR